MEIFWLTGGALLCFAANSILCRLALESGASDPATFTSLRLLAGALTLSLLTQSVPRPRGGAWISGLLLFGYAGSFSFAYMELPATTGTILLFASVQATMIAGGFALGERVDARQWAGLAVAAVGVSFLLLPGLEAPPRAGAFLMTVAGAAWGMYSLQGREAPSPSRATTESFTAALPFTLILSAVSIGNARISTEGVSLALASGALASGLGYLLWRRAMRKLNAVLAAAAQLAVPVLTALLGYIVLSESLSPRLLVSSFAVLGGVGLAATTRYREHPGAILASSKGSP